MIPTYKDFQNAVLELADSFKLFELLQQREKEYENKNDIEAVIIIQGIGAGLGGRECGYLCPVIKAFLNQEGLEHPSLLKSNPL